MKRPLRVGLVLARGCAPRGPARLISRTGPSLGAAGLGHGSRSRRPLLVRLHTDSLRSRRHASSRLSPAPGAERTGSLLRIQVRIKERHEYLLATDNDPFRIAGCSQQGITAQCIVCLHGLGGEGVGDEVLGAAERVR